MRPEPPMSPGPPNSAPPRERPPRGLLAGMRIRKKLIFLHTTFSLALAGILLVFLRPAINEVVVRAEANQAAAILRMLASRPELSGEALTKLPGVELWVDPAPNAALPGALMEQLRAAPREPRILTTSPGLVRGVVLVPNPDPTGDPIVITATVRITEARGAVLRLYGITIAALLAVYALVAASLEVFVLPSHVYGPIGRLLRADRAVQEGNREEELIPESAIPADELGEIMRSRNDSVSALRRHEHALGEAMRELERVATDLKRKNHLLETARRNLADADRLASLGMMSAGIAHELNTPLTVIKGLVETLNTDPGRGVDPRTAALMLRVVRRLERLGDSLLDFARVRPPACRPVALRPLVDEAATLVRLDRAHDIPIANGVPGDLVVPCDGDRIVQVLVNIVRNGVDAIRESGRPGEVLVDAEWTRREDASEWVSITVSDTGPGIDADILPTLFEPFASTRLDSRGTGLGLAVAEGIVREHGGILLARNRADRTGAVFEIVLPASRPPVGTREPARESEA